MRREVGWTVAGGATMLLVFGTLAGVAYLFGAAGFVAALATPLVILCAYCTGQLLRPFVEDPE